MSQKSSSPAFVGLDMAKNVFQASLANDKGKFQRNFDIGLRSVTRLKNVNTAAPQKRIP